MKPTEQLIVAASDYAIDLLPVNSSLNYIVDAIGRESSYLSLLAMQLVSNEIATLAKFLCSHYAHIVK